jgi:cytochrome P450
MMQPDLPDFPFMHKLLKKRIEGKYIPNPDKDNSFFAVTGKAVEDVALNKYSSFVKYGGFKRLGYVLGSGLFTTEEPEHMRNKKEISPAFDSDHIKKYEDKASLIIDNILSGWDKEVDVRNQMKFFVFKSVMEIFFSETIDDDFVKIKNNIETVSDKVAYDIKDDVLEESTRQLREVCKGIVDRRLESKENKNDFVDMIIKSYENNKIDFDDLYSETLSLFLGSYETTAYVLEWAIYYLSINKDWQEKIFEKENLEAFIKEVLRMAPPIWNSERIAIEDVTVDGIPITAGTKVTLSSYAMHRDKDVFKDPDLFKPERWLEDLDPSKGEYFPFLFGKRQCIGKEFGLMEMRIVLIKIAQNFNIELINKKVSHLGGLSYRPKEPIRVYVTKK